jgi:hypothetical protein
MDKAILEQCKEFINENKLEELKEYYSRMMDTSLEYQLPWEYIYQQTYIHACLKKRQEIVDWLRTLFDQFDIIAKIGIRQMFSYGNYLLRN